MIKMTIILQINTNRSRGATELVAQTAKELNADIIVITEPNVNRLDKNRITDESNDAATRVLKKGAPTKSGKGKGFVWIEHNNMTVYNCYISPNVKILEFQNFLDKLENSIREQKIEWEIIVTGDFNAISTTWGNNRTTKRGKIMEEWIGKLDLTVANTGDRPTFERRNQTSFLDLTLFNENLTNRITNWAVLTDLESLSDHKYIIFDITDKGKNGRAKSEQKETAHKVYMEARHKLNLEIAKAKTESWEKLCDDVEKDPWGTGYKIIADKFKIAQPKLDNKLIESKLIESI